MSKVIDLARDYAEGTNLLKWNLEDSQIYIRMREYTMRKW